jgi:hypothetical protein
VTEIFAMPSVEEAPAHLERVDVVFMVIGVDKAKAETHRAELAAILAEYPVPGRLENGPSYIEIGGVIGDQGAAFQLFAIGKVLGFWNILTPEAIGASGDEAVKLAGAGFIMISGYAPEAAAHG